VALVAVASQIIQIKRPKGERSPEIFDIETFKLIKVRCDLACDSSTTLPASEVTNQKQVILITNR
jgi:hypothetical protein